MRTWTDVSVGDLHISHMALNPLGFTAMGSFEGDPAQSEEILGGILEIDVQVETADGMVRLNSSGASVNAGGNNTFHTERRSEDTTTDNDEVRTGTVVISDIGTGGNTFRAEWSTGAPIDIDAVSAVVINSVRIPVGSAS